MADMTVEERMAASAHIRGKMAALNKLQAELAAELSQHDKAIDRDMRAVLSERYPDYAPRVTFYRSERPSVVPYTVEAVFAPVENS